MPAVVAGQLPGVFWVILAWVFGGFVALVGALCFAELTTTYPDRGGDYGYLKRAYHPRVGFAFSWAAFWVIRPGNIGTMAMIFGEFAVQAFSDKLSSLAYGIGSVVIISLLNLIGITFGKTTQNVLTVAKVVGILLIVVSAFFLWAPEANTDAQPSGSNVSAKTIDAKADATLKSDPTTDKEETSFVSVWSSFWLAMVFVMFTFGGWNDIAFVASEVKKPEVNLLRSLILGTLCVLVIYLLVNFGLVYSLGFDRMQEIGSKWGNPTSYLIEQRMGDWGEWLFALLVCVSCLGAINAMIFTSPRIYSATAEDYPGLSWLAGSQQGNGWWRAMMLQMGATVLFISLFSSDKGIENITAATAPIFGSFCHLPLPS